MADRKTLGNILIIITAAIRGTAFVFQRMGMNLVPLFLAL